MVVTTVTAESASSTTPRVPGEWDTQATPGMSPDSPGTEWREGWRIVAGAAVGMGTGAGLYLMVMSLFVVHITRAFGWTRGDLGIAGMVAFVTGALTLPTLGRLLDRHGFRRIVLICVPALSLLYPMIALQPGYYPFHLGLMVWAGIFGAGTGPIAYTRPVIAAFHRQRGLALGVATAGTSISAMIAPPLLASIIGAYGWRAGLFTMSAITGLVGLPLALALIGRARESKGGVDESVWIESGRTPVRSVTRREALRDPRLWLLILALTSVNIPGSGVVAQLAPLLSDKGLPATSSALVLSVYAAGLLIGRLATGYALDRFPTSAVAAAMALIPAIGITLLRVPSPSFWLAAVAAAMIGLQQGSEVDVMAYFVSSRFGVAHYSAIYGVLAVAGAASTAASIVFFGKVHDLTGSYNVALSVGAAAFCCGALAFLAMGRVRRG